MKTGLKELLIDIRFSSFYGTWTLAFLYFVSSFSLPTVVGNKVDVISEEEKTVGHVDILIALIYKSFIWWIVK